MTPFRLTVLGRFELADAAGADQLERVTQPKRLALLLYLALARPARFHRRDTLLPLLWPELDDGAGRHALRQAVHYLRTRLGAAAFPSRGADELGLSVEVIGSDLLEFERAIRDGRWQEALALHQGPLVPGFHCDGTSAEYSDWLDQRRRAVRRQAAEAARHASAGGRDAELGPALDQLRQSLAAGSFDEGLVRELMRALVRAGDGAGALRLYGQFEERLQRELGMGPSSPTTTLAAEIRSTSST